MAPGAAPAVRGLLRLGRVLHHLLHPRVARRKASRHVHRPYWVSEDKTSCIKSRLDALREILWLKCQDKSLVTVLIILLNKETLKCTVAQTGASYSTCFTVYS